MGNTSMGNATTVTVRCGAQLHTGAQLRPRRQRSLCDAMPDWRSTSNLAALAVVTGSIKGQINQGIPQHRQLAAVIAELQCPIADVLVEGLGEGLHDLRHS